ncbi:MAG: invasion associated locus B family protein [Pseudomonadota bacterium]|nr:invasion associated locus B family protein [Pseudomonadota bacterium]
MHLTATRSSLIRSTALAMAAAAALALPAAAQTTQPAPAPTETPAETPAAPAPAQAAPAPAPAQQAQPAPAPAQPAPAQPQQPPQVVVATHRDWSIVCLNGDKPCIMRQIGKSADGREVMDVSIRRIAPQQTQAGTVEAVLDVRVPLGILLREGLSMQIDSAEAQRAAYSICLGDGCLMREPLPNAVVANLKKGAVAKFGFVAPQNNAATKFDATISLTGFTAAYNSLEP